MIKEEIMYLNLIVYEKIHMMIDKILPGFHVIVYAKIRTCIRDSFS